MRTSFERLASKGVIDGHGHIDFNTAKRIDYIFKTIEVDLGVVMNRNTR